MANFLLYAIFYKLLRPGQARVFLLNLLNYPELFNTRSHLIIRRRDKVSGLDCCCMAEVHMRRTADEEIPQAFFWAFSKNSRAAAKKLKAKSGQKTQ